MTETISARLSRNTRQKLASAAAVVFSGLLYWFLQVQPLTTSAGFSWRNFRQYFPYDQYSYLAIAVNVKNGNMAAVEPFTESGANHYPRLYYVFLGLVSRLFNSDIIFTWQVIGIGFQLVMVASISWLIIRLTGRAILGVFGFVPSIIGTFAVASGDNWYHPLDNHGVLWGAFGVLFTLNGESAALAVAVTAICLLVGLTFPLRGRAQSSQKARSMAVVLVGAAVGMLANVQTYSFLTAVYLLVYATGAYGLLRYGRRVHVVASLVLLAAVLMGGTSIAVAAGPLLTLVAGLLAALPGFFLVLLRLKFTVIAACVAVALAASPTILGTLLGLAGKDDFLSYRELSSSALGVPLWTGLVAGLVPLLMLILIFWAGLRQGNKAWMAFALGAFVAWPLVASNDLWGANQEPYRFWIDSFTIVTALAVPVLIQVAVISWGLWREHRDAGGAFGGNATGRAQRAPSGKIVATAAAGAALIVAAGFVSLADYAKFSEYVHNYGTASFSDPQALAIKEAAMPLTASGSPLQIRINSQGETSERVMFDPCISPFRLKALTGLPTAFYNLGLAWPTNEKEMRHVLLQRSEGVFAQSEAEQIGIRYVMIDSSCQTSWEASVNGSKVSEVQYLNGGQPAKISIWSIGR